MGRPLRVDLGGYVYHVVNRANARMAIFEGEADYLAGTGKRDITDYRLRRGRERKRNDESRVCRWALGLGINRRDRVFRAFGDALPSGADMSVILAIDLGRYKAGAWSYRGAKVGPMYQTVRTVAAVMHDLIVAIGPWRVVIEIGSAAGWVKGLW